MSKGGVDVGVLVFHIQRTGKIRSQWERIWWAWKSCSDVTILCVDIEEDSGFVGTVSSRSVETH